MYEKGDSLESVIEEACYYDGLRTSTGWPAVDELTRGLSPGAVWTVSCDGSALRRSAASWFAGRLGSLRGRSVLLSTTAPAHESALHVLAPLVGCSPLSILAQPHDSAAWAKADRIWTALDLTVAGPDDDLDEVVNPADRTVNGLVVDRADLLPDRTLAHVWSAARSGRRWTVLTSPTSMPSPGLEPGDVSITVDRVGACDARLHVSTPTRDAWFDAVVSSVGRWQVSSTSG